MTLLVAEEEERLAAPRLEIVSRRQNRQVELLLLARPHIPEAVDVGMMQKEQWIDRRQHVLHQSADAVVYVVVWLALHDPKARRLRMKWRLVAPKADKVFRSESLHNHRERDRLLRRLVEAGMGCRQSTHFGRRHEHGVALHLRPDIVHRPIAAQR